MIVFRITLTWGCRKPFLLTISPTTFHLYCLCEGIVLLLLLLFPSDGCLGLHSAANPMDHPRNLSVLCTTHSLLSIHNLCITGEGRIPHQEHASTLVLTYTAWFFVA